MQGREAGAGADSFRAVLGYALVLAGGRGDVAETATDLVWKLERFGEEIGRLGADGGEAWIELCDAVGDLCRSVYDRDFEIFLPEEGEPVREEFHEVAGPGGHTISKALRWGVNDATSGENLLRAIVEVT